MTQMIARYQIAEYKTFKTAFDIDAEDRGHNGLSLLQLWHENDLSIWALFTVQDAAKAKAYLEGPAGVFNTQAGVLSADFHMLETL